MVYLQTKDLSPISKYDQAITSGSGNLEYLEAVEARSDQDPEVIEATRATRAAVSTTVALLDARRHPGLLPQFLPQQKDFPFEDAGALLVNGTPVLLTGLFRLRFPPSGSLRWSLFSQSLLQPLLQSSFTSTVLCLVLPFLLSLLS